MHSLFPLILLLLVPALPVAELCHPEDKVALLKMKNSFTNRNALFWWNPATDCCDWVGCDESTGRVTRLEIINDDVAGHIPSAISGLTHLTYLRLRKLPRLVGPIPPAIAELSNLTWLELSWANLTGPVPSFLARLTRLSVLDLSFNRLSGSIPPELASLPAISYIGLDRNRLTGSIPDSFGRFVVQPAPKLVLSHNRLTGDLPPSLGDMDFQLIDFSRNSLTGNALMLFNASKIIQEISISRNQFSFDFSRAGFSKVATLITVDISHNRIWGTIPGSITDAIYLQFFNVSYNRLCGPIPQDWKLKYLSEVFDESSYAHNRCLCGPPLGPCKAT